MPRIAHFKYTIVMSLFLISFWWTGCQPPPAGNNAPHSIVVDSAGIACAEPHAAAAGLEVLKQGGNAIDALVAVGFAMAVTYPRAGNLGGGGFLLYRSHDGKVTSLDFRETAPAAATPEMFWQPDGSLDPEKSLIGALAAGIPGTVRGLYLAHQKFASMPWKDLLQPAIRLAREGFPVSESLSNLLKEHEANFKRFPESYRIFYPGDKAPEPGTVLRQEDLAATLERIAAEGDAPFYQGEIADKIIAASQRHGGIFSKSDFLEYTAIERPPVRIAYRDHLLYSMAPPSSGGLMLQGILGTLQQIDLPNTHAHNRADYIAYLSEVEKQWYARRNVYLGDPAFVDIPFQMFASPDTAAQIARSVSLSRPYPAQQMPEYARALSPAREAPETTHISVLDAAGNAAAMTYTLNGNFGSYLVAGGTGILLNNEMDDFAGKPGAPNLFGLVQGWANAVEPGKRMLSSMTPTIVEKDGRVAGILGSPGGSTIITAVLQVVLNKIDYRMTLAEALSAGRFHQQWLPDSIKYESGKFSPEILEELQSRGFDFIETQRLGDVQAIWRSGNQWEICCDPRGTGVPVGY